MARYSFALALLDEGDIAPGDAEFLHTLNPNIHISLLLKRIQIVRPQRHLQGAKDDVRELVKRIVPFQVLISTKLWHHGVAIGLTVTSQSIPPSPASGVSDLANLRSDILKIFDHPAYSVAESEKRSYTPHITLRRDSDAKTIADAAKLCSDAIRSHIGLFGGQQMSLIIRGINLFQDTVLGPRFVEHFPFRAPGSFDCCMFKIPFLRASIPHSDIKDPLNKIKTILLSTVCTVTN
ncbi:hypothetical protein DFH07DRAFT_799242 [Mycena maculata]|uniref:Uncharacterized protein n=1 Tax=Mycena maculata TaxID=230809 RepID=A0AAD7K0C0_9AGAR|nr:hypothetical protein DFH07DRAFT_799242 [Mycena maculata]